MKTYITYLKKSSAAGMLVAMVLAISLIPAQAFACSCMRQADTNTEAFQNAGAVFAGRYVKTSPAQGGINLTFDVSRTWKGPNLQTINVKTSDNSASCGWAPESGKEYLVYAYTQEDTKELGVNLCSRTFILSDASSDLAALGAGNTPAGPSPEEQASATPTPPTDTPVPTSNIGSFILKGAIVLAVLYYAFDLTVTQKKKKDENK